MIKKISIALILFSLQACTAKFQNMVVSPSANKIQVTDLRPATERKTEMFSWFSFSCAFGVQRFGDAETAPEKMDVLRQRVFEKYGDGTELKINHFVVYQNIQASSRGPFWGPLAYDIAGYAVRANGPSGDAEDLYDTIKNVKCDPKESALGAFSPDEYSGQSAFVVYVDIELKGKRSFVRYVGEPTAKTIDTGIITALQRL
jgi:hypothetical protein